MRYFDSRKEGMKKEHDYFSQWEDEEKDEEKKKINELPMGNPRTGLKGKYIKPVGHVGKLRLKRSYGSYFKSLNEDR